MNFTPRSIMEILNAWTKANGIEYRLVRQMIVAQEGL